jgi:hypothetical protein
MWIKWHTSFADELFSYPRGRQLSMPIEISRVWSYLWWRQFLQLQTIHYSSVALFPTIAQSYCLFCFYPQLANGEQEPWDNSSGIFVRGVSLWPWLRPCSVEKMRARPHHCNFRMDYLFGIGCDKESMKSVSFCHICNWRTNHLHAQSQVFQGFLNPLSCRAAFLSGLWILFKKHCQQSFYPLLQNFTLWLRVYAPCVQCYHCWHWIWC